LPPAGPELPSGWPSQRLRGTKHEIRAGFIRARQKIVQASRDYQKPWNRGRGEGVVPGPQNAGQFFR